MGRSTTCVGASATRWPAEVSPMIMTLDEIVQTSGPPYRGPETSRPWRSSETCSLAVTPLTTRAAAGCRGAAAGAQFGLEARSRSTSVACALRSPRAGRVGAPRTSLRPARAESSTTSPPTIRRARRRRGHAGGVRASGLAPNPVSIDALGRLLAAVFETPPEVAASRHYDRMRRDRIVRSTTNRSPSRRPLLRRMPPPFCSVRGVPAPIPPPDHRHRHLVVIRCPRPRPAPARHRGRRWRRRRPRPARRR